MEAFDDGESRYDAGMRMRKEVLGKDYVERSLAAATDFSRPVQDLVTEYCWGEVWTSPQLDPPTRSLLNIVMLTALNRMHELAVHVRGAIRNGCTPAQIQGALLQSAIYCGVPAALESFRVAERVLAEMASEGEGSASANTP